MTDPFLFDPFLVLSACLLMSLKASPEEEPALNPQNGFMESTLTTDFQAGPVLVQILAPDHLDPLKKYPVLYILPVEGRGKSEFGNGLAEAKKADIANKYGVICVYPSFTQVPWYGNHATDPAIQQEDYILRSLIPWVDGKFPTQNNAGGRWLLGFSKSGWGAFTLLFRHPDVFGFAAAWDVPFMLDGDNSGKDWGPMGLAKVMGTKENFQQHFVPVWLAAAKASTFNTKCRLALGVGDFWKEQMIKMHDHLDQLGIVHVYRPDLTVPHRWDSGWFVPMVEELVKIAKGNP